MTMPSDFYAAPYCACIFITANVLLLSGRSDRHALVGANAVDSMGANN